MLNVFRENLKSLKWLLWVVAASMVLYLGAFFNDSCSAVTGAWAARVDGSEIPAQELLNRTRDLDRQYQQLFGESYGQMRQSLRLGSQAIEGLIQRELILADAKRMGISAGPEDVATAIRENPAFQDASGGFIGTERYQQLFEGRGRVSDFEAAVADDLVVQRWQQVIGQAVTADEGELERLFRERTEKTAVRYAVVAAADQQIDTEIDADDEAAWYAAHEGDYRRGEGRRIRFVTVARAGQRDKVEVTDDEVAKYYEDNKVNYEFPEQRKARHILFQVAADADPAAKAAARAKAEAALARLQAGEDFARLAAELSDDTLSAEQGGDLGWFGKGRMVPPFEAAAFGTAPGGLAPVTESQFGFHVIFVEDARDAGVTPLEEVTDDIRRNLQERGAEDRTEEEATRIRSAVKRATDLATVASKEGLSVEERLVTESDPLTGLGASPEFLPAVFDLEVGGVTQPVRVLAGMAIVALDEIVPPGLAPLEQVRAQVRSDILTDRGRRAALEAARAALTGAASLDAAAKKLALEPRDSGDLGPTSGLAPAGASPADLEPILFGDGIEVGRRDAALVPAGALIYEVTRREPFDPDRFRTEKVQLGDEVRQRRQSLLQQSILDRLRADSKVEVNAERVAQFDSLR